MKAIRSVHLLASLSLTLLSMVQTLEEPKPGQAPTTPFPARDGGSITKPPPVPQMYRPIVPGEADPFQDEAEPVLLTPQAARSVPQPPKTPRP